MIFYLNQTAFFFFALPAWLAAVVKRKRIKIQQKKLLKSPPLMPLSFESCVGWCSVAPTLPNLYFLYLKTVYEYVVDQ